MLEKEQKEVINRIESLKKQIDWYTAEDQLAGELTNGENILAKAKETFESLKELRSRLSFHDASIEAVAYYRDITTGQENTSKLRVAIEKFSCTIDKLCKDIATANSELETLKVKTAKAHENYELQKPHINRAREIKVETEQLKSNLNEKKQTLRDAGTALEKAEKEIADNKNDIANATEVLTESRKALETTKENISNNRLMLENDLAVTKKLRRTCSRPQPHKSHRTSELEKQSRQRPCRHPRPHTYPHIGIETPRPPEIAVGR